MDKIKKLSDAIRLGATIRPQCQTRFFTENKSCAIGAAIEALGLGHPPRAGASVRKLFNRFPELESNERGEYLWQHIMHLNDDGWTREQIADWLASKGY